MPSRKRTSSQSKGRGSKATKTADAEESSSKGETTSNQSTQVLEAGHLFFFYRPKVGKEEVHSYDDVQKLYCVIEPHETPTSEQNEQIAEQIYAKKQEVGKAKDTSTEEIPGGEPNMRDVSLKRVLIITSKRMPPSGPKAGAEPGGGKSIGGRHWAFVDFVTNSKEAVQQHLGEKKYSTKTRGERVVHAARACGVARYDIVRHSGGHVHLVYALVHPEKPGQAQKVFNISKEGSQMVMVKNPHVLTEGQPGLSANKKADLPPHLLKLFEGKRKDEVRFIPLDPPEFLNYNNVEIIMVGIRKDLAEEFGSQFAKDLREEAFEETKEYKHHVEQLLKEEVGLTSDEHSDEHDLVAPAETGKLV